MAQFLGEAACQMMADYAPIWGAGCIVTGANKIG